jgi:hypothetical protein
MKRRRQSRAFTIILRRWEQAASRAAREDTSSPPTIRQITSSGRCRIEHPEEEGGEADLSEARVADPDSIGSVDPDPGGQK